MSYYYYSMIACILQKTIIRLSPSIHKGNIIKIAGSICFLSSINNSYSIEYAITYNNNKNIFLIGMNTKKSK